MSQNKSFLQEVASVSYLIPAIKKELRQEVSFSNDDSFENLSEDYITGPLALGSTVLAHILLMLCVWCA